MKKNIKKIASMVAITTMILVSSFSSLAAGGAASTLIAGGQSGSTTVPTTQTLDVYGRVKATGDKYCLDIAWENLQFDYNNDGTWDPSTHTYTGTSDSSGWVRKGGTGNYANFEIVNHSNRAVDCVAVFEAADDLATKFGSNVTIEVADETTTRLEECWEGTAPVWLTAGTLDTTEGRRSDGSYCILNSVSVDGKPDKNSSTYTKMGAISLTFSAVTD